jgi:DNA-binding MarR family transcriptional regulator
MLRTEWRVLFHLGIYGELTATEIGTRARMHKTKISRAVQKLEERRFIKRVRDVSDRRSERLSLTPTGQAAYEDLREVASAYDARLTSRFAPEDVEKLRVMLRALSADT